MNFAFFDVGSAHGYATVRATSCVTYLTFIWCAPPEMAAAAAVLRFERIDSGNGGQKNGNDSAWRCLDVAFGFAHSIKKRDSSFSFGAGSILSRNGVIWWFNGRAFHDNATSSRFLVI